MTHPFENSTAPRRAAGLACALVYLAVALPGCHFSFPFARQNQFGPPLPRDASKAEIIGRVNDNISKVKSWSSTNVHISGGTMLPMRISAQIAVEAPRHFRLQASALGSEEADFGSNDERFWFWVKRGEPACIYQASHEQMGQTEILRQIPFQPDWLMEVLGVVPLDDEYTLASDDAAKHTANLVSERVLPSGQAVKRVIQVDTRYGLVMQHSLYTDRGALIARAKLGDHRRDKESGAILPYTIQIEWPQAKLSLNIEIVDMEVNPENLPAQIWELPTKKGYRTVDLGALPPYAQRDHNGRTAQRRYADSSREPLDPLPLDPLPRERFVMPVQGEGKGSPPMKTRPKELPNEPSPNRPADAADDGLPDWARDPIPAKMRQRSPSTPQ